MKQNKLKYNCKNTKMYKLEGNYVFYDYPIQPKQ